MNQVEKHARNKRTFFAITTEISTIATKVWAKRKKREMSKKKVVTCLLIIGVIFPKTFCKWIADDL